MGTYTPINYVCNSNSSTSNSRSTHGPVDLIGFNCSDKSTKNQCDPSGVGGGPCVWAITQFQVGSISQDPQYSCIMTSASVVSTSSTYSGFPAGKFVAKFDADIVGKIPCTSITSSGESMCRIAGCTWTGGGTTTISTACPSDLTQAECNSQEYSGCTWNTGSTTSQCSGANSELVCKDQNAVCARTPAGKSTKIRTVTCKDSSGTVVADSYCSGTKPATLESCSAEVATKCKGDINDNGKIDGKEILGDVNNNGLIDNNECEEERISRSLESVIVFDNSDNKYVAYQWFKNGTIIPGATKQYYYSSPLSGSYHAIATNKQGKSIKMCAINIDGNQPFLPLLQILPNPVNPGEQFVLQVNYDTNLLEGAEITMYTKDGRKLQTINKVSAKTTIKAPNTSGLYVIRIVTNNCKKSSINLKVQ